jgi:hypothetical protein
MVPPLAITTASSKVAGESYASRERAGVAIRIQRHLVLASAAWSLAGSASTLDEEGVDVRVAHAHDLVWSYAAAEEGHNATGESEDGILQGVLDVRPQLLSGNVEVEEAWVTG